MIELIQQFKRDSKQQFKNNYTLNNPTHLVKVMESVKMFRNVKNDIMNYAIKTDVNAEATACRLEKQINNEDMQLLIQIITIEKNDKKFMFNILNNNIMNNDNIGSELEQSIKSKADGLNYAVALGIIDDYMNYLETGIYKGPTTEI